MSTNKQFCQLVHLIFDALYLRATLHHFIVLTKQQCAKENRLFGYNVKICIVLFTPCNDVLKVEHNLCYDKSQFLFDIQLALTAL